MKEKYYIVSENEYGKNPHVILTDSSTPDFEIAGPFNSMFAAKNKLKKLTKNKKEWGGTAESSETGAFIGGENASSMYNTGGGLFSKGHPANDPYAYYSSTKDLKKDLKHLENHWKGKEMPEWALKKKKFLEDGIKNKVKESKMNTGGGVDEDLDNVYFYAMHRWNELNNSLKLKAQKELNIKPIGIERVVSWEELSDKDKLRVHKWMNDNLDKNDFYKINYKVGDVVKAEINGKVLEGKIIFMLGETAQVAFGNNRDYIVDVNKIISKKAKGGPLKGNQKKLDLNKNGKLDAEDFKMLRGKKMIKGGGIDSHYEKMIKDNWENISYAWETGGKKVPNSISNNDAEDFLNDFDNNFGNMSEEEQSKAITKFKNAFKAVRTTKMENGGAMNETFPDTDAMSYKTGGGVKTKEEKIIESKAKSIFKNIKREYGKFEVAMMTEKEAEETVDGFSDIPENLKKQVAEYLFMLTKTIMENGGELNETFPDTDAMSYAKGGGTNKMAMSYKLNRNDEHNISLIYHTYKDKMSIGELKQYISDELKINYFEVSSYMNRNGMMEKGGSISTWSYSIGGL